MRSQQEVRRLPFGGTTRSVERYVREWRKVGRVVAKVFGPKAECCAFDPGLTIWIPGETSIDLHDSRIWRAVYKFATEKEG